MDTPASTSERSGHGLALLLGVAVLAAWGGGMALALRDAALPPETGGTVLAVFPPGTTDDAAFAALVRAGGEPLRKTGLGFAWVARGSAAGFVGRLRAEGALAAFGEVPVGPSLGGCIAVSADAAKPPALRLQP